MEPNKMYVGVKGLIFRDGKLLVLKRKSSSGQIFWDLPGGRMGMGEMIEETLRRELHEELPGIGSFEIGNLVHARKRKEPISDGTELCILYYLVTADPFEVKLSPEHMEFMWASINQLQDLVNPPKIIYSKLIEQLASELK